MPWYEKEDLEKAREMTAIEYLKRYEPQRLKPCRGLRHEYELTDHDSFKINEITSQWHWKSRDIGGVVSLKRLLNQSILKSWSSKMIKKSLEAYFFTLKNKIVFCKKQF